MINFTGASIMSSKDFSKSDIEKVLEVAERFLPVAKKEETSELLAGKVLAALFYEPSTRTRLSFETAMQRLGGSVISVVGLDNSSLVKGRSAKGKKVEPSPRNKYANYLLSLETYQAAENSKYLSPIATLNLSSRMPARTGRD